MSDPIAAALALASPKKSHVGPIVSEVPGREDKHAINVPAESFVLPADIVSALGQGNSLAGMKAWKKVLGMSDKEVPRKDKGVPIMAAGGELVVPPEIVAKIGKGDLKKGHEILRHAVLAARKDLIKTLKSLKDPHR